MIHKNILLSIATISILYTGCTENETKETQKPQPKEVVAQQEPTETSTVDKVANSVITHVESTAKKTEELAKNLQKSTAPVVKDIANKVKEVQKNVVEASDPIIKKVQQVVQNTDANKLYKKCASCHGLNGEKKALNKSAIIKNWNAQQIEEALLGYKNGSYGGAMKGVMKAQVTKLTENEINALSNHIADFK